MSAPQKKASRHSRNKSSRKIKNEPPLIKIDSDDDNESEVDFKKDIESDIDME